VLIYYFELKKAAFWFMDFEQPSLGDIQKPLVLRSLPIRRSEYLFTQRYGAAKKRRNWQASDLPSADRPAIRRLCGLAAWRANNFFLLSSRKDPPR
jgi:hypothetical protein